MIQDKAVLMKEPFRGFSRFTSLIKDNMDVAKQIMSVIDEINKHSEEIA